MSTINGPIFSKFSSTHIISTLKNYRNCISILMFPKMNSVCQELTFQVKSQPQVRCHLPSSCSGANPWGLGASIQPCINPSMAGNTRLNRTMRHNNCRLFHSSTDSISPYRSSAILPWFKAMGLATHTHATGQIIIWKLHCYVKTKVILITGYEKALSGYILGSLSPLQQCPAGGNKIYTFSCYHFPHFHLTNMLPTFPGKMSLATL